MAKITIGHDGEVFLRNKDTLAWCSAIGLVGGTKENPHQVPGGALQEDNVMAELNIMPASTANEFVSSTKKVLNQLNKKISEYNLMAEFEPLVEFAPDVLDNDQARQFACEPDMSMYTLDENNINVTKLLLRNQRVAGGHIHVGVTDDNGDYVFEYDPMSRVSLAKLCELYIGLPAVLMEPKSERKNYYGKAGSFRIKPYGIEYRVPSNFWLKSEAHMRWAFRAAKQAAEKLLDDKGQFADRLFEIQEKEIQNAINHGDKDWAKDQIQRWLGNDSLPEQKLWSA